ncbi:MAG: hypothetical protein IPF93_11395 [Saprospiraceae bacterium]|nr:hypothetical protein [Saprospiraceae bacterium]
MKQLYLIISLLTISIFGCHDHTDFEDRDISELKTLFENDNEIIQFRSQQNELFRQIRLYTPETFDKLLKKSEVLLKENAVSPQNSFEESAFEYGKLERLQFKTLVHLREKYPEVKKDIKIFRLMVGSSSVPHPDEIINDRQKLNNN